MIHSNYATHPTIPFLFDFAVDSGVGESVPIRVVVKQRRTTICRIDELLIHHAIIKAKVVFVVALDLDVSIDARDAFFAFFDANINKSSMSRTVYEAGRDE